MADAGESGEMAMRQRGWERFAPLGALGFLASLVLGALAVGASPPAGDAPAEEIATYFEEHQGGHLANTFLAALGSLVFYPWFLASLWQTIRRVEGPDGLCAPAALIGGIALLIPLVVQLAAWGAAALQAGEQRDPAVAAALFDLGSTGFLVSPFPAAVLVIAATLASRPSGSLLPNWLVRLGLPLAAVMLLGTFLGLAQFMFVLFAVWLISVAIVLMRSNPSA
ncbi:MAG: hypothetical protein M3331_05615 [Actinomycetota bacterium]|nr:hypothetical protein [Actinomycetota bacterium]